MISRRKLSSIALAASLLLAASAVAGAEKVDLKLNLKPGQTFKIVFATRSTGSTSAKGQTYQTTESFSAGLAFSVESVDPDGTARMKVTFENVSYSLNQPGGAQLGQAMSRFLAALGGQSFTMEVTSSGDVRSVTGIDAAADAALKALATYPEQVKTLASMLIKQIMSEPMWKLAMSSVFSILPQQPVEVGERWSRSFSGSAQGTAEVSDMYCKILDRANGVARVKVFVDVKSLEREPAPGMRLSIKGTGEGIVEIEEATGLVRRGSTRSNLKGSVTGAPGQNVNVPAVVTATTTISRH
jgi:hypothetical protein